MADFVIHLRLEWQQDNCTLSMGEALQRIRQAFRGSIAEVDPENIEFDDVETLSGDAALVP